MFFEKELIGEKINGKHYLIRWTLFRCSKFVVYLHKFCRSDMARDMHDHPAPFISIGLWGSYLEHTPRLDRYWSAPWFRRFPSKHIHRITTIGKRGCWTLCITFRPREREWGFWVKGAWVPWTQYHEKKN